MNRALVRRVAAAIGEHLEQVRPKAVLVIGYDGRIDSRTYAHDATRVLAGRGHRVLLYEQVVTTPQLAHAVVWHQAEAGLMITASHNPAAFCGYKLKGHFGGAADSKTSQAVEALLDAKPVKSLDLHLAKRRRVSSGLRSTSISLRIVVAKVVIMR